VKIAAVLAAIAVAAGISWLDHRPTPVGRSVVTVVPAHRASGQPKRLIVYASSMGMGMAQSRPVLDRLLQEPALAGSDLLTFDPRAFRLTPGPQGSFATRLRAEIDAQWLRAGGYDDIVLAGASLGSILVRHAFLASAGGDPQQPRTIPWSDRVSRIVLLAGIGRGVNIENEGRWKWVIRVGRFVPVLRRSIVYDQLRGAEPITALRIAWVRYFAELYAAAARGDTTRRIPTVVQMLGTQDDFVSRADNIDLKQFPNALYLDVPGARHGDVFSYGPQGDSVSRYAVFREAFIGDARLGNGAAATPAAATTDTVRRVIMLLHGIRSTRDNWVRRLAPQLRRRIPNVEVVESSQGLTSMLGFSLPSVRRRHRLWLQDQYAEALARHPAATIDVVAHSNGTYVLGESLQEIPVIRFDRVALLGSVLPVDYPWRERSELGQVGTIRSDRAANDRVVGILCSALHGLGMTDVGTSGWRGFDDAGAFLYEPPWIPGGHDATISDANLASVVEFLASGIVAPSADATVRPSLPMRWASSLAPWLTFLVAVSLVGLALWWLTRQTASPRWPRIVVVGCTALVAAILLDVL
jgi:hypothetical protein